MPQGGILSPILFNITLDSIESLEETHPKVDEGKYADDNSGWVKASFAPIRKSKNRVKKLENIIVPATECLIRNLEEHGFKVNIDKTQIILFNTRSEAVWTINGQKISTQPSVKYLGVTFDKFLTFGKHIKNRCEIGQKAINILKRLGNGKFGLNSRHRQRVFKGYILPKITYGEEIYHNAAKSHLNNIDKLQNQGMRLIAGVPLSTSSMALSVLTKIPPAYLRREERLLHLWKRIAYNPKNPANSVYETELSLTTEYKKTPFVVTTKRLLEEIGIDKDSMIKLNFPITLEHKQIDIDTSLTKLISKKQSTNEEMLAITKNHLNTRYPDRAQIYTDGSKKDNRSACAYTCELDDKYEHYRISDHTAIMTAELTALDKAFQHAILDHQNEAVVIITDSLSSAQSCLEPDNRKTARPDIVESIYNRHDWLVKRNTTLTILWAPSHINLRGNDIADSLANSGLQRNWINEPTKLGPLEIASIIKKHMKNKFQIEWDKYEKALLFKAIKPTIEGKIEVSFKEQEINRLRLNVPAFHLPRNNICETCQRPLTPDHVLLNCFLFDQERELVRIELEKIGLTFTVANILHPDRKGTCKNKIHEFIESIHKTYRI